MKKTISSLLLAVLLAGCATKSNVRSDGTTDKPVFPAPYSLTFDNKRGTFPTLDELLQVKAGMTKDQLYKLLGRPHYDEGMFGVREWDYLFHFHTPGRGTNDVSTCQFKVLYDRDKFTRQFYWRAVDPVDGICPPSFPAQPDSKVQKLSLAADALFAFDRSSEGDILPEGRAKLDALANNLRQFPRLEGIHLMGHTDRLGTDAYNQDLSERRANTVRNYLIARGVPAGIISSTGKGEREPVKDCPAMARKDLIQCLQPNRRVDVEIIGVGDLR